MTTSSTPPPPPPPTTTPAVLGHFDVHDPQLGWVAVSVEATSNPRLVRLWLSHYLIPVTALTGLADALVDAAHNTGQDTSRSDDQPGAPA